MNSNPKVFVLATILLLLDSSLRLNAFNKYDPTWESLDTRPLPNWYDESKIGIFLHYGVWSVPGTGFPDPIYFWQDIKSNKSEPADFMKRNYAPNINYPDFASSFKFEFFNPQQWVEIFKSSGAKYVILVGKHFDGFTMWPSQTSFNWNSKEIGPNKDIIGELVSAIRNQTSLNVGIFHSLFEFFNPLYLNDRQSNFTKQTYIQNKVLPELKEIVNNYKPDILWSDGDWDTTSDYWNSKEFIAWLYNESPVSDRVITNDRWGLDSNCKHGDFRTCGDGYNPEILTVGYKWENVFHLDRDAWAFRNNMNLSSVLTIEEIIKEIVTTVSSGGNVLINVGVDKSGIINVIFEERLKQMGKWLDVNGEAIYKSKPWKIDTDIYNPGIWYTSRKDDSKKTLSIYAISLVWPQKLLSFRPRENYIMLEPRYNCSRIQSVQMLGVNESFVFNCHPIRSNSALSISLINLNSFEILSQWAWTFKINFSNA